MLINSNGQVVRCGQSGAGIIGTSIAGTAHDKCVDSYKSAGYMELEEAGVTGIARVVTEGGVIRITAIADNSPASNAGIAIGDNLISVNGQPVSVAGEAVRALFGKANTQVSVVIRRGTAERTIALTRASYPSVYVSDERAPHAD
jgi:C-terminal processing protease CtpA/Prc